jgi:hypothetical protein
MYVSPLAGIMRSLLTSAAATHGTRCTASKKAFPMRQVNFHTSAMEPLAENSLYKAFIMVLKWVHWAKDFVNNSLVAPAPVQSFAKYAFC